MTFRITVICDGCEKKKDIEPHWFRTGYSDRPAVALHPYYNCLPKKWVSEVDGGGELPEVLCPKCAKHRDE